MTGSYYTVEGRSFHGLTDQKPLVFALHSARVATPGLNVAEFTSDLRHVAGVADRLSRPPWKHSLPRSTQVVSVRGPAGLLAALGAEAD